MSTSTSTTTPKDTSISTSSLSKLSLKNEVPLLKNDGSNFQNWKFRTLLVLTSKGLKDAIDGKETDLMKINDAMCQIALTIEEEPLSTVINAGTVNEAWRALCERYEGKGIQKVAYLLRTLFRSTLSDTESMEPQINKMLQIARTIKSLEHDISDAFLAIAIVISLPPSYEMIQAFLMAQDTLTVENVKIRILAEESRQKEVEPQNAFLARFQNKPINKKLTSNNNDESTKRKRKPKKICDVCGKPHLGECRYKKAEEKPKPKEEKAPTKGEEIVAKIAREEYLQQPVHLFMAHEEVQQQNILKRWVVDSGASSPMSSNRKWFKNYKSFDEPVKIRLGDNSYILAYGEGQINIELKVGSTKIPVIVQKVLYSPDVHGNLLSVRKLTLKGFSITFDSDDVCRIYDQKKSLIGIAHFKNNLYLLDTTTDIPEQLKITNVQADVDLDDTDLANVTAKVAKAQPTSKADAKTWHRCLGHISVESVLKMVRKNMVTGMSIISEKDSR
ncbi:MAG TPA: hypothetical protein VGO47_07495, partial [Chlamydiales bacterium]|nr:hypothetical protein [Chlamydiales bacterium]